MEDGEDQDDAISRWGGRWSTTPAAWPGRRVTAHSGSLKAPEITSSAADDEQTLETDLEEMAYCDSGRLPMTLAFADVADGRGCCC